MSAIRWAVFFPSFPSFSLDNLEVFEDAVFVKSNHTYCFNFCVTLVLHPLFCFTTHVPKAFLEIELQEG